MEGSITIQASRLRYTPYSSSSSWGTPAYQGKTNGQAGIGRVGAIQFGGLLTEVDWSNKAITGISLRLKYTYEGAGGAKNIDLYRCNRTTIGGTGAEMRGTKLGRFNSEIGPQRERSQTYLFSPTNNAAMFANMSDYILSGTSDIFVMYYDETNASYTEQFSAHFVGVQDAKITIDYKDRASTFSLDKLSADIGSQIKATIVPMDHADGTVLSHKITWVVGGTTDEYTLASGVLEHTYTVPGTFTGAQISASCTIESFLDGVSQGVNEAAFTVMTPASWNPRISNLVVKRAAYNADTRQYEPSPIGEYMMISYAYTHFNTSVNSTTAIITCNDDASLRRDISPSAVVSTPTTVAVTDDTTIYSGEAFDGGDEFVFTLTLATPHITITRTYTVNKSTCIMHMAENGVSIGGFMEGTGNRFESHVPFYPYSGIMTQMWHEHTDGLRAATSTWVSLYTFTAPHAGVYWFHGMAQFSASSSGRRVTCWFKGSDSETMWDTYAHIAALSVATYCNSCGMVLLEAGEQISFRVWQNSGGALDIMTDVRVIG